RQTWSAIMQTDRESLANRLQNKSPEHASQVKEGFIASLHSELDGLLTLLEDKDAEFERTKRIDPASGAYHAVAILQFVRYGPAADLCVRRIDTRSTAFPVVSDEAQVHFPFFPFAVTASALGVPVLSGLSREILTASPDTTRFQLTCLVLKEILGEE